MKTYTYDQIVDMQYKTYGAQFTLIYGAEYGYKAHKIMLNIWKSKINEDIAKSEIEKIADNLIGMQAVYYTLLLLSHKNKCKYRERITHLEYLWDGIGDWEF